MIHSLARPHIPIKSIRPASDKQILAAGVRKITEQRFFRQIVALLTGPKI
jgi:hypothetical protein